MANVMKPGTVALRKCVKALVEGKAIVYPTETVYGLGVDATSKKAIRKLFEIKARDPNKPVSIAFANVDDASKFVEFNESARILAKKFLPGPLTLVLKAKRKIPMIVRNGAIGIRIPSNKFALSLLRKFGKPITATSANISGFRSVDVASDVDSRLWKNVEIVIDDSKTEHGKESTVIDVTGKDPKILREGVISEREIAKALGRDTQT